MICRELGSKREKGRREKGRRERGEKGERVAGDRNGERVERQRRKD